MNQHLVLSVEDNDADFHLIEMALKQCRSSIRIYRVCDGEEAITFLGKLANVENGAWPELILLDANMPGSDGFAVLRFIKSKESISHIPVVMFTSSANPSEKNRAFALGARDFVTKSSDLDQILSNLSQICSKHLGTAI